MPDLLERLRQQAVYLGGGLVGVESFLNHQVDPQLIETIGTRLAERLSPLGINRVLTAETGGLAPALMVARALQVPLVYARRHAPRQPGRVLSARGISRSQGVEVIWSVAADYLPPGDQVAVVDDFISRGETMLALSEIILASGARLRALACVLEKSFEGGRQRLTALNVPILALAQLELKEGQLVIHSS